MKNLIAAAAFSLLSCYANAQTQHSKHGMLLIGDERVFASHVVYKAPHNFQVILEVKFRNDIRQKYLTAKTPENQVLFVLDPMDLKELSSKTELTGSIVVEDSQGGRVPLVEGVKLSRNEFEILYFDELPLDLSGHKH